MQIKVKIKAEEDGLRGKTFASWGKGEAEKEEEDAEAGGGGGGRSEVRRRGGPAGPARWLTCY
eukprot:5181683-Pyramimonas_sp.AAC.1